VEVGAVGVGDDVGGAFSKEGSENEDGGVARLVVSSIAAVVE
jgi:hypothetical protein